MNVISSSLRKKCLTPLVNSQRYYQCDGKIYGYNALAWKHKKEAALGKINSFSNWFLQVFTFQLFVLIDILIDPLRILLDLIGTYRLRMYYIKSLFYKEYFFSDHFCHNFWVGVLLLCCCTQPKVREKIAKKRSTDQRFILTFHCSIKLFSYSQQVRTIFEKKYQ